MVARKTVSFGTTVEADRNPSERVFATDPEVLRAENARLQRDLTRALEERNRLLKKTGTSTGGYSKGGGLRVLEERLENSRIELARANQDNKALSERTQVLEQRLNEIGAIPGMFIGSLEELIVSSGGVCTVLGTAVENAAIAPERVVDRFNAARDALGKNFKHSQEVQNQSLQKENNKLKEALDYQKSQTSALREERDHFAERSDELDQSLKRSTAEVAVRDEKLAELQKRISDMEQQGRKQGENYLKLKSRVKSLRGVVDPEFISFVTGTSTTSKESWRSRLFSWNTFAGLVIGAVLMVALVWSVPELGLVPSATDTTYPVFVSNSVRQVRDHGKERSNQSAQEVTKKSEVSPPSTRLELHRDPLKTGGFGPELVGLQAGEFMMGTDRYAAPNIEKPARTVSVSDFYISRFEITFDQYDAFARATGRALPSDEGWGRGDRPVINVSWDDARSYAAWLSDRTDKSYRLPNEAEWEFAMGGGSREPYWWGSAFEQDHEICFNCGTRWSGRSTAPVGSAQANPQGLYDMGGNVMEWVQDCLTKQGTEASTGCEQRVVRGGAFNKPNDSLRITARRAESVDTRRPMIGFRVVREVGG
jgi:formylglycine-generating enzyme required for sulfatase activity